MIMFIREKVNRLYNRLMQKSANLLFKGVLKTDPIKTNPNSDTILYCALDRSSCRQYIAAAKSFLRYNKNFAVVAQSDGTLDSQCVREIEEHLPGIKVLSKKNMLQTIQARAEPELIKFIPPTEEYAQNTPIKIMYLKFLNVIFQFNGRKVIIIDSDLLFLRKPEFILNWAISPYTHDFYSEGSNAKAKDFHAIGFQFTNLNVANFSSGTIGVGGTVCQQELINIFSRIHRYDHPFSMPGRSNRRCGR